MAETKKYLDYEGTTELVNKLKNYADDKIGDVDLTAYEKVEDANEAHKELCDRLDELAEKMNELTGDTVEWVTSEEGFLIALVDSEDSLLLGITKEAKVYFSVGILDGIVDSEKSLRDVLGDYVTTAYLGEYYYTAAQVDQKLLDATQGEPIDLSGYLTKQEAAETYQPLGDYATKGDLPTKTSELTNDSGFLTDGDLGDYAKTSDLPTSVSQLANDSGYITSAALDGYAKTSDVPTKVSELTNDSEYITEGALSDYVNKQSLESITNTLNELTEKVAGLEGDTVKWVTNDDYLIAIVDSEDSLLMGISKSGELHLPGAGVKRMEYVSEMPSNPVNGTLYLIPE